MALTSPERPRPHTRLIRCPPLRAVVVVANGRKNKKKTDATLMYIHKLPINTLQTKHFTIHYLQKESQNYFYIKKYIQKLYCETETRGG